MKNVFPISVWARGIGLALALLAGTLTGRSQGTIVFVTPAQPIYYSYLLTSHDIDINNDGIADFNLNTPNGIEIDLNPLNDNAILSVPEPPPDLGAFIYALSQGTRISSSLDPALAWWGTGVANGPAGIVACANIGCLGYFQNQTDAYAGIRLKSAGYTYYGWIHIQNLGLNAGQISDWAYQTSPDAPIFAGQVPEPSTSALLMLGAALIGFWRKHHNDAKQ